MIPLSRGLSGRYESRNCRERCISTRNLSNKDKYRVMSEKETEKNRDAKVVMVKDLSEAVDIEELFFQNDEETESACRSSEGRLINPDRYSHGVTSSDEEQTSVISDKIRSAQIDQRDIERMLLENHQIQAFQHLMMEYDCAMSEVRTKLEVLNKELSLRNNRNPFESIKCRIKKPVSIYGKIQRKDLPFSVETIEENLCDIAGIRVICSFVDDIYMLAECLKKQDDIRVIREKDYISKPKPNGYRSLHLILEVPIFLTHEKKYRKVEVQFRTIAMDFWASLEHKLQYKQNLENAESISEELMYSAELIHQLDCRMQQIREKIDTGHIIKGTAGVKTEQTGTYTEVAAVAKLAVHTQE